MCIVQSLIYVKVSLVIMCNLKVTHLYLGNLYYEVYYCK